MAVNKRQGKALKNRTKEGPRTGVRTSGRANSTPGQPNLHKAVPGEGEKKIYIYNKRSQRARGLSLSCAHTLSVSVSLFFLCLLDQHALIPRGCICLYFLNKTDLSKNYNTGCPRAVTRQGLQSVASNLCCDETEPRRLHSPDIYGAMTPI